jgi:hypothetical protein
MDTVCGFVASANLDALQNVQYPFRLAIYTVAANDFGNLRSGVNLTPRQVPVSGARRAQRESKTVDRRADI